MSAKVYKTTLRKLFAKSGRPQREWIPYLREQREVHARSLDSPYRCDCDSCSGRRKRREANMRKNKRRRAARAVA